MRSRIVNPSFRRAADRLGVKVDRMIEKEPEVTEKPQEESPPTVAETVRKIKRSPALKRRGNWATQW
jgi:hypothetical protein